MQTRKRRSQGFSVFLLSVLLATPALCLASGLDCSKASSPVEKAICSNYRLIDLDKQLSQIYSEALQQGSAAEVRKGQRQWLRTRRDVCKTKDCIETVYEKRIEELSRVAASRPFPTQAEAKGVCEFVATLTDRAQAAGAGKPEPRAPESKGPYLQ